MQRQCNFVMLTTNTNRRIQKSDKITLTAQSIVYAYNYAKMGESCSRVGHTADILVHILL